MLVLKHILEMDNLVGIRADGKQGDFVQDFHRTVDSTSNSGAEFGRVRDARFAMDAFANRCKQAAENKQT